MRVGVKVSLDSLWTIDGLVAAGTLLLALATFVLARITVTMGRQPKRQVELAREQIEISGSAM